MSIEINSNENSSTITSNTSTCFESESTASSSTSTSAFDYTEQSINYYYEDEEDLRSSENNDDDDDDDNNNTLSYSEGSLNLLRDSFLLYPQNSFNRKRAGQEYDNISIGSKYPIKFEKVKHVYTTKRNDNNTNTEIEIKNDLKSSSISSFIDFDFNDSETSKIENSSETSYESLIVETIRTKYYKVNDNEGNVVCDSICGKCNRRKMKNENELNVLSIDKLNKKNEMVIRNRVNNDIQSTDKNQFLFGGTASEINSENLFPSDCSTTDGFVKHKITSRVEDFMVKRTPKHNSIKKIQFRIDSGTCSEIENSKSVNNYSKSTFNSSCSSSTCSEQTSKIGTDSLAMDAIKSKENFDTEVSISATETTNNDSKSSRSTTKVFVDNKLPSIENEFKSNVVGNHISESHESPKNFKNIVSFKSTPNLHVKFKINSNDKLTSVSSDTKNSISKETYFESNSRMYSNNSQIEPDSLIEGNYIDRKHSNEDTDINVSISDIDFSSSYSSNVLLHKIEPSNQSNLIDRNESRRFVSKMKIEIEYLRKPKFSKIIYNTNNRPKDVIFGNADTSCKNEIHEHISKQKINTEEFSSDNLSGVHQIRISFGKKNSNRNSTKENAEISIKPQSDTVVNKISSLDSDETKICSDSEIRLLEINTKEKSSQENKTLSSSNSSNESNNILDTKNITKFYEEITKGGANKLQHADIEDPAIKETTTDDSLISTEIKLGKEQNKTSKMDVNSELILQGIDISDIDQILIDNSNISISIDQMLNELPELPCLDDTLPSITNLIDENYNELSDVTNFLVNSRSNSSDKWEDKKYYSVIDALDCEKMVSDQNLREDNKLTADENLTGQVIKLSIMSDETVNIDEKWSSFDYCNSEIPNKFSSADADRDVKTNQTSVPYGTNSEEMSYLKEVHTKNFNNNTITQSQRQMPICHNKLETKNTATTLESIPEKTYNKFQEKDELLKCKLKDKGKEKLDKAEDPWHQKNEIKPAEPSNRLEDSGENDVEKNKKHEQFSKENIKAPETKELWSRRKKSKKSLTTINLQEKDKDEFPKFKKDKKTEDNIKSHIKEGNFETLSNSQKKFNDEVFLNRNSPEKDKGKFEQEKIKRRKSKNSQENLENKFESYISIFGKLKTKSDCSKKDDCKRKENLEKIKVCCEPSKSKIKADQILKIFESKKYENEWESACKLKFSADQSKSSKRNEDFDDEWCDTCDDDDKRYKKSKLSKAKVQKTKHKSEKIKPFKQQKLKKIQKSTNGNPREQQNKDLNQRQKKKKDKHPESQPAGVNSKLTNGRKVKHKDSKLPIGIGKLENQIPGILKLTGICDVLEMKQDPYSIGSFLTEPYPELNDLIPEKADIIDFVGDLNDKFPDRFCDKLPNIRFPTVGFLETQLPDVGDIFEDPFPRLNDMINKNAVLPSVSEFFNQDKISKQTDEKDKVVDGFPAKDEAKVEECCGCKVAECDEYFFSRTPWGSTLDQATVGILRAMSLFAPNLFDRLAIQQTDSHQVVNDDDHTDLRATIQKVIDFLRRQLLGPTIAESILQLVEGINFLTTLIYGPNLPYESSSCCQKRQKYYDDEKYE